MSDDPVACDLGTPVRPEGEDRAVGITDLIAYRDCPRRASYGIRRHVGNGQQDPQMQTPEAGSRAAAYGSCVHDALAAVEDGHDDASAAQLAFDRWGHWLHPDDLQLLREDLENFHRRDLQNVRTVLAEGEIRVPLTLRDGKLAYFRARIDRLYERLDLPGHFVLVDYKSSRWARSEQEVQEDLQLWAYDWLVWEYFAGEVTDLLCIYDQLRYGQIPVRKTDAQRAQMRDWLVAQMSSYFADEDYQEDGLLAPRYNQWCPWCPILESCPIVERLSDFALARIAGIRVQTPEDVERYSELYSTAKGASKVIKRFVDSMNELVRELPQEDRSGLGFKITERRNSSFPVEALSALQSRLGEQRFLELVSLPKNRLESLDADLQAWVLSLAEPTTPTIVVTREEPKL